MLVLSQETISDTSLVVAKWFVEIHSTWESKRISRLINLFLYKFRMGSCVHKLNLRSVNKNREILSSRFKSAGYEVTLEDAYTIIATR